VLPRPALRVGLVTAGVVLVPWTWFPLRDRLGGFGDLLAVFLPIGWWIAIAAGVVVWRWRRTPWWSSVAWAVSVTVVAAIATAGPRWPDDRGTPSSPIRLVASNVFYRNDSETEAAADLRARDADVVVLSELTYDVLQDLRRSYPYVVTDCLAVARCDDEIAILSRFPLRGGERRSSERAVLRVIVDGPAPFVLLAAHLPRPSVRPDGRNSVTFGVHRQEIDQLVRDVALEDLPVVIAGDLNLSDRASGYRELTGTMVDAARTGWAGSTFPFGVFRPLMLRIDHVFVPEGWCSDDARTVGIAGSDHRAVETTIGPCA
jgi:endonuclease/exonuclease/phosphatase (EEP) superfamily protein YafD